MSNNVEWEIDLDEMMLIRRSQMPYTWSIRHDEASGNLKVCIEENDNCRWDDVNDVIQELYEDKMTERILLGGEK